MFQNRVSISENFGQRLRSGAPVVTAVCGIWDVPTGILQVLVTLSTTTYSFMADAIFFDNYVASVELKYSNAQLIFVLKTVATSIHNYQMQPAR